MALKLITAAASQPVSVADVEAQIRATVDDTTLVELYIGAVTAKAEGILKRALVTQTWEYSLDYFPPAMWSDTIPSPRRMYASFTRIGGIQLPMAPVQTIVSVTYIDVNGATQTLNPSQYQLTDDDPPQILPAYGVSWPSIRVQPGAVKIRYTAGYGSTGTAIPNGIKAWILMNVASLYENRETITTGENRIADLNTLADSLLYDYRQAIL